METKTRRKRPLIEDMDAILVYASFWKRSFAFLIDIAIIFSIFFLVKLAFSALRIWSDETKAFQYIMFLIFFAITLYFPLMESSSWQATIGKRIMHMKVAGMQGEKISIGKALGRFFCKILSTALLFYGYIMAAFNSKRQALHDKIVLTLVLKA